MPETRPRVSTWLLRRALPPETGAAILGDLLEELDASGNTAAARRRFTRRAWSVAARYVLRRTPATRTAAHPHGEAMGDPLAALRAE